MKNKLLVVNFFPAFYPPSSGGEQRYYYLYFYLSHYFDITLLSPTHQHHKYEVINFNDSFREHRVPKEPIHIQLHQELSRYHIGPECSGLVVALAGGVPNRFHDVFLQLSNDVDLIIHDCPFTLPYDLHFGLDKKPRIYNSYNVELLLMKQIFQGPLKTSALDFIETLEKNLLERVELTFATSDEEKLIFCDIYNCKPNSIYLAPNGFEPSSHDQNTTQNVSSHFYQTDKPHIFFMGSGHPPNIEAGKFIIEEIAPQLPNYDFIIIGSVCKFFKEVSNNIKLLGFVSEADKTALLMSCSVAINPMISGAGTNLKMLDYMAAGVPVVTTKTGARGLSLTNGSEALVVDMEEFPTAINKILSDQQLAKQLGLNAKQTVFNHYTWKSIAKSVAPLIADTINKTNPSFPNRGNTRIKLLVVNDFPISNAVGGGQIRIKELLTELSNCYDIIFLCLSDLQEYTETIVNDRFIEICIPKTLNHRLAEIEKNALSYISVNDIIAADYCLNNSLFKSLFIQYAKSAKAIIFEHPYLDPLLTLLQSYRNIIVYSSLNCELQLKQQILESRPDFKLLIDKVKKLEQILLQKANLVVCVSKADRDAFAFHYPNQHYLVLENGVRLNRYNDLPKTLSNDSKINFFNSSLALFVGSSHKPNIDAVHFIKDVLAPALPNILFGIIGSVCDALRQNNRPKNIILFGVLDTDEKNLLMKNACFAINPMFTGGGSSLKVPDFLAAGLPLVSTAVGVRGYDLLNETHYLLAESSNFIERVHFLASDINLQSYLSQNGTTYVKQNLDWSALAHRYKVALNNLICYKSKAKRKLLVITYRFTDPPLGGAEVYLNNVLREIASIGDFIIDVATYNIGKLFNKWHFSADYQPVIDQATPKPNYLNQLIRFSLDAENQDELFLKCRRLFSLWMKESLSHGLEFLDLLSCPTLLGGWNFPEQAADGTYARWSSKKANIFLGAEAKSIRIQGTVIHKGKLSLHVNDITLQSEISDRFNLQLTLPEHNNSILDIYVSGFIEIMEDVRELGVYFTSIEVENQSEWYTIKLEEDYTTITRSINVERWVQSLINQTELRDSNDDNLFLDVRGPKSSALLEWLNENISDYEIVLTQGVPFSSSVSALNTAQLYKIPCILLPHYHMEDKYYHWRSFYRAFQNSDLVLASPSTSKRIFFDKLNARSTCVFGGAADPKEFTIENLNLAKQSFKQLHGSSSNPFILYLGRKSGGKNYHLIIQALAQLMKSGYFVDLIMIGPDEDLLTLNIPNVYYYGLQPRDVVIGALAECLCVVNMSTSESFGIVLIEAWLAGRPVIAQKNCVAFSELVEENKNGFLAHTPEEISKFLIQYITDQDFANRCGANGRETAKAYTWFNLATQINASLLQVLGVELRQFANCSNTI